MSDDAEELVVDVQSMYGAKVRKGLVSIRVGDRKPVQMRPDEARTIALDLIGAAEAAEQDEFLLGWLPGKLDLSLNQAGQILLEFREARKAYGHD